MRNSCVEGREVKCFNAIAGGDWPKIKFNLFGIAARPTEKLAAHIILFAALYTSVNCLRFQKECRLYQLV